MAENSILGSEEAATDGDAFAQAAFDQTLNDASLRQGTQVADETIDSQSDGDDDAGRQGSGEAKPDVTEKRISDAQRRMHEAIRAEAEAKAESKYLKLQLEERQKAKQREHDEALFKWMDTDEFKQQLEDDPAEAFKEGMKKFAGDLLLMQSKQTAYIDAKMQRADPLAQRIDAAYEELSKESWFQELGEGERRGAAMAVAKTTSGNGANGSGHGNQPPPTSGHGSGHRVTTTKKEVPMDKDPRYREALIRMGGLQSGRRGTSLNDAPDTQ